ncbi:hypothetical protein D3C81_1981540 [compost metagenome]
MWKACSTAAGISEASRTNIECFTIGRVTPRMSISWKASVPMTPWGTLPVMQTMGTESIMALAIPVIRLVAPGPDVAMQTPTLPEARA